jgi:serine/threonine protein kinase
MGAVYRVRDTALERDVAMKVLSGAADPASRSRLEAEARVLAQLEHPGLVPVHDVGALPDGRMFYVMKLVHGERLDGLSRQAMTLSERLRLIVRVADAVAFAHARGIVHRDLSPGNIMVGAFGEVLVLDWGLATSTRDASGPGVVVGTPGFMAPEQAGGLADARSDVYAIGALLAWLTSTADGRPERLPRPLRSILDKARAAPPADRYEDAAALSADLVRFLDGAAVAAHRETVHERVIRFARRYRVAILLVVGYLVMRIALLWYRGL